MDVEAQRQRWSWRTWLSREHRRRLHSTNLLERLHKEIKRRTRVADEDRRRLGIAAVRAEEREDP